MAYKYFPILRARQQEIDVLQKFDFGTKMVPMVEIIKEKDRKDNQETPLNIYSKLFSNITAEKILIDLPIYLSPKVSTSAEVRTFYLSTISNLSARIAFYTQFKALSDKLIPVISVLEPVSNESETLIKQYEQLTNIFPQVAFRIFYDRFDTAIAEIQLLNLKGNEIIIYDLDTANITNPIVIKHKKYLDQLYSNFLQVVVRSAINSDIQNITLDHGEIIGQADNSLRDLYKLHQYKFAAFGDYAGVKKDELTAGGSISPGMVFYNPDENLYYGFRGPTKSLEEFEKTIIPAVLGTGFVQEWIADGSDYIQNNQGYDRLINLRDGKEPSKNQAKFKWISIMHYLHCIRTMLNEELI